MAPDASRRVSLASNLWCLWRWSRVLGVWEWWGASLSKIGLNDDFLTCVRTVVNLKLVHLGEM